MRYGVREICDVVFKAKADMTIGTTSFKKGQPVLYIDSAKTSTIEGAATTVYATGGRGNTRLITWEGEKTLTFTVEDALLSPLGFAILSGAGLFKNADNPDTAGKVYVHKTAMGYVDSNGTINLADVLGNGETIASTAPLFILATENDGSLNGTIYKGTVATAAGTGYTIGQAITGVTDTATPATAIANETVFVDFYVQKDESKVAELQIDAANFAGYYYVEASTLFRRQVDGIDAPVEITYPNVKIQSNFTFNMASTGDPSTFTFTMDAMPGYTWFDSTKKVLCVMQIVEDGVTAAATAGKSVMDDFKDNAMHKDVASKDSIGTNDYSTT